MLGCDAACTQTETELYFLTTMKIITIIIILACAVLPGTRAFSVPTRSIKTPTPTSTSQLHDLDFLPTRPSFVWKTLISKPDKVHKEQSSATKTLTIGAITVAALTLLPDKAVAIDSFAIKAAVTSYAHIFSILAISGCLVAERLLVHTDMTADEETMVNQIDFVYGLLAALLIGSGLTRAILYGKGGDFYSHEVLFWVKMILSGVWGGLSIFPTIIFRKRTSGAEGAPPLTDALVARIHSIINAELSAIWTIPILASLMSYGVGFSPNFPWQIGAVVSVLAMVGSFWYYGQQALNWSEEETDEEDSIRTSEKFAVGK